MNPRAFPSIVVFVVFTALVAVPLVVAWAMRSGRGSAAVRPDRLTRCGELLALLIVAAGILFVPASWQNLMRELPELRPELRQAYLAVVGLSGAALVATIVVGLLYRVWLTALGLAVIFVCLCITMARADKVFDGIIPGSSVPTVTYTFDEPRYPDAELFINGVPLGKMPVTLTWDQIRNGIPYWEKPPDGLTSEAFEWPDFPGQEDMQRPWTLLEVPPSKHFVSPETLQYHYYVQARLGQEWSRPAPEGGGGGGGTPFLTKYAWYFSFDFPEYDQRVRDHLEAARSGRNPVDEAWARTAESFGQRAWQVVPLEGPIKNVFEDWAAVRWGLRTVKDAPSAWAALERIAADPKHNAPSPVARAAVDMLIPALDPEAFVRAVLMRDDWHCIQRRENRRGIPLTAALDASTVMSYAVVAMDRHLELLHGPAPNIIERKIAPELVYRHQRRQSSFGGSFRHEPVDAALELGWPGAYHFLIRQPWREAVKQWTDPHAFMPGTPHSTINVWLYRLLCLPNEAGRDFRQSNEWAIFQTADQFIEDFPFVQIVDLQFLFLDNELGDASPAMKYWPRFHAKMERTRHHLAGHQKVQYALQYLYLMDEAASSQMSIDVFRGAERPTDVLSGLNLASRQADERWAKIAEVLLEEIQRMRSDPAEIPQQWTGPHVQQSLTSIERKLRELRIP